MRTATVVSLVILSLLAPPATSQVPDDNLIVPGARIGKASLTMTVVALVRMLGEPLTVSEGLPPFGIKTQPGVLTLDWTGPFGLGSATRDDRNILILFVSDAPKYSTAEGVKLGTASPRVKVFYGEPTVTILLTNGWVDIYEDLGLAFRYFGRSVSCIAVFRPGMAKAIWKFAKDLGWLPTGARP